MESGTKMHPSGYQLEYAVSVQYCKTELFEVRLTPTTHRNDKSSIMGTSHY